MTPVSEKKRIYFDLFSDDKDKCKIIENLAFLLRNPVVAFPVAIWGRGKGGDILIKWEGKRLQPVTLLFPTV